MYMDLNQKYWWTRMKVDITDYVARCDTFRQVKTKHQRLARLLQPLHTTYSCMEMGRNQHGLYSRVAIDTKEKRFDMGHSGQTDQGSSLYPSQCPILRKQVRKTIHRQYPLTTWSTEPDYVRPRYIIHGTFLEKPTCCLGNTLGLAQLTTHRQMDRRNK
jgi:hypothetical protein